MLPALVPPKKHKNVIALSRAPKRMIFVPFTHTNLSSGGQPTCDAHTKTFAHSADTCRSRTFDLIIQQNTKKKTINNLQCHKKNKKNIQVLQHAADPLALPLRCRVHATQSGLHAQTTFAM